MTNDSRRPQPCVSHQVACTSCAHTTTRSTDILSGGCRGSLSWPGVFALAVVLAFSCRSAPPRRHVRHDPDLNEAILEEQNARKMGTAKFFGQLIFFAVNGESSPDPD